MKLLLAFLVVVGLAGPFASGKVYAQQCAVVNLMPQFWRIADDHSRVSVRSRVENFRSTIVHNHGDLYSTTGVGFSSDRELNSAIAKELSDVRAHAKAVRRMSVLLQHNLPIYVSDFKREFPDFHCSFPIYLLPSLGKLDGAGREVNHVPSLLIGVDNVATIYTPRTLRIFVDHELFHRYHFQVAGFSDDRGDREILWRALWAEGLATYASKVLNRTTLQDALILPKDLVHRAQPRISTLIERIMPDFDRSDSKMFASFFEYHLAETEVPARAGYYIGVRACETLSRHATLFTLAHLQSATARSQLREALASVQRGDSTPK